MILCPQHDQIDSKLRDFEEYPNSTSIPPIRQHTKTLSAESQVEEKKNNNFGITTLLPLKEDNLSVIYRKFPPRATPRICYICHTADNPGKFDPEKALSLGLKKGPEFGKLQKGQSVTNAKGVLIKPEDVISPKTPGSIFMIVDCPDLSYFEILEQKAALKDYMKNGKYQNCFRFIIHMTGSQALESDQYKKWMNSFPDTTHVYCLKSFTINESISILVF